MKPCCRSYSHPSSLFYLLGRSAAPQYLLTSASSCPVSLRTHYLSAQARSPEKTCCLSISRCWCFSTLAFTFVMLERQFLGTGRAHEVHESTHNAGVPSTGRRLRMQVGRGIHEHGAVQ